MAVHVLVVDDSAFMRKMLTQMIESDPRLRVIGTARDGEDALAKVRTLPVDVITLDINMPRMDGLTFLERLMKEKPLPVVMVSSLTHEGSEATMEALALGAVDFVPKPSGAISLDIETVRQDLLRKVRAASRARVTRFRRLRRFPPATERPQTASLGSTDRGDQKVGDGPTTTERVAERRLRDARRRQRTEGDPGGFRYFSYREPPKKVPLGGEPDIIVALGASTGGPAALEEVICSLPADLPVGIVITQHMQAGFTRSYAARLNARCAFTVREAEDGDALREGLVLVAPGDYHMVITAQRRVRLNQDPPVHYVRPAADVMMLSVAAAFGRRTIGVILTGMGRDGAEGMAAIKQAGGRTLVQDEETSVIFSMPSAVIAGGWADEILPLNRIAERIAFHCWELKSPA